MTFRRFFSLPPTLPDDLRSNVIHLFWDIAWWGLYMGSTAAFLTIYATRCGATAQQIGLLSALPALLSLAISLPVGRLLKRFPCGPVTALGAFASRILLLAYPLLPWVLPIPQQPDAILVVALLVAIPNTFIGISYGQFFMEGIPNEWRGMVVGGRNAIVAVVTLVVTVICGQILTYLPFPNNYQAVFLIGFVGAIMTSYHIWKVKPFNVSPPPPPAPLEPGPRQRGLNLNAQGMNYAKILGLLFLFNLVNNMLNPLVPNLLVNQLKLSDATISIGTGLANILVFSVSLFIASFTRRAGNRRAVAIGAMLLAFHAVALALAGNAALYLLSAAIGGIAAGVLNTAQYNYNLENVPEREQSSWLAWNLLLGNAAVLIGALGGPAVAHLTGTMPALLLFGGLRLTVGFAILRWG
jgi:MFS family permease